MLNAIVDYLFLHEAEVDIYAQGTAANLTVGIGQVDRIIIKNPAKNDWERIKKFILDKANQGNYVFGYLGHGLHRATFDVSIKNSHHPDAYLFVPDVVIKIIDGYIVEITGDFSKYVDSSLLNIQKTWIKENSDYSLGELTDTDYLQKITAIQDWIKERNQDDRITLSRQILIEGNFLILDHIASYREEKFANPYNRIIYQKFFDEEGKLNEYGGVSPELLVDGNELKIQTNKLSGTYAKTGPMDEQAIWADKKILDEHEKSVAALVKNLNKVTDQITVKGPALFELTTLFHLLSIVTVQADSRNQILNLIQSLVLTGTTAGEAGYQKLYRLEGIGRGAYYGLSVLFGPNLEIYSCPQILRCVFRHHNIVWTQVGGSVSRLSNPQDEFIETVVKAKSILRRN